jgi:amidohydrolase
MPRVIDVNAIVAAHEHELIAMRRHLHAQPEASGLEHLTTAFLVERLLVEGLQPVVLAGGTGLVCDVSLDPDVAPDPETMPAVALRADIDGLAMDELNDTPYRSRFPGLAHACGHDVHTAVLVGAALALLDVRRNNPRRATVRLIFEPAEEAVPGGAVDVIREGWLDHMGAIFGVHCDPKLDVGSLGLRIGALTSAADQFTLTLTGPGGHTARPRQTVDLVRWTGRIVDRLWDGVQARAEAQVILVFGAVHAGAAPNVIPAISTLRGSFRTSDRSAWAHGEKMLRETLAEVLTDGDIGPAPDWSLKYTRGLPPVVNDAATTDLVRGVVFREFGPDAVADTPQSMGGDSFAWYTEAIPGTYVRLGTHDPRAGAPRQDLHSATFDVDERAIAIGAALLAGCALTYLDDRG